MFAGAAEVVNLKVKTHVSPFGNAAACVKIKKMFA